MVQAMRLSLKFLQMLADTYVPWQALLCHVQPEPEVSQQVLLRLLQYVELEDFAEHQPEFATFLPQEAGFHSQPLAGAWKLLQPSSLLL